LNMPFLLLEETFEALTISECERVFDFLEERKSQLLEPKMFQRSKLVLLRMCNEVLRRLSKASNTEFCGRVLVFLATAFPLSERSAVNNKGTYNTGNMTEFTEMEVEEGQEDVPEPKESEGLKIDASDDAPVDAIFYNTFWSLQKFFADPSTLYQVDAWSEFTGATNTVLDAFESHWLGGKSAASAAFVVDDFYFPKFLTSSRLMNLQLKDAYFGRHCLVQYLILIQCLRSISEKPRTPIQTLKEAQKKQLAKYDERVLKLLENMTVDGHKFTEAVVSILDRENNWIQWKGKGCKPYEKEVQAPAKKLQGKRKREQGAGELGCMGDPALSKLFEQQADQLQTLQGESRNFQPKMKKQMVQVMEEIDPVNEIEEEFRKTKEKVFAWRTIRIVAGQKLNMIKHASGQGKQADKTECNPDGIANHLMEQYLKDGWYEN